MGGCSNARGVSKKLQKQIFEYFHPNERVNEVRLISVD